MRIYVLFVDIDECENGTSDCEQLCTNADGSYLCQCGSGFVLNPDGKRCNGTLLQEIG